MKNKKFIFTGLMLSIPAVAIIVFVVLFFVLDMYYHHKYMELVALNHKGYRGRVIDNKKVNEIRCVMLGGSSVFGYGVRYYEALPYRLEEKLQAYSYSMNLGKKITVINLAFNSEGAYGFYHNLKDFYYLDYDYVIIYSGYNDIVVGNTTAFRHSSFLFRHFGYFPIIPMLVKEKIMVLKNGGKLDEAYWGKKTVFKPSKTDKVKIKVLKLFDNTFGLLEEKRVLTKARELGLKAEQIKKDKWFWYKHFMKKTIDFAFLNNKKVIIISPARISSLRAKGSKGLKAFNEQQESLKAMLDKEYKNDRNVIYVSLEDFRSDKELTFDGMHFTAKGNKVIADAIAQKIKEYITP